LAIMLDMSQRRSRNSSIFSHRALIAAEAVLLIGLGKTMIEACVLAMQLPNWGKVLFIMAVTLGVLGGLILIAQKLTVRGMAKTHAALKAAMPVPYALVHAAVFGGLFLLYAHFLGLRVY
jgi:hypothetical protein